MCLAQHDIKLAQVLVLTSTMEEGFIPSIKNCYKMLVLLLLSVTVTQWLMVDNDIDSSWVTWLIVIQLILPQPTNYNTHTVNNVTGCNVSRRWLTGRTSHLTRFSFTCHWVPPLFLGEDVQQNVPTPFRQVHSHLWYRTQKRRREWDKLP